MPSLDRDSSTMKREQKQDWPQHQKRVQPKAPSFPAKKTTKEIDSSGNNKLKILVKKKTEEFPPIFLAPNPCKMTQLFLLIRYQ